MKRDMLYTLHKKYAPDKESLDLVWSHSLIVAKIAEQVMKNHPKLDVDKDLVLTGCLLHDIGVYFVEPCNCHPELRKGNEEPYVTHGVIGADIVRREKFPEEVAKIIERHIGVGISKKQIIERNIPLPHKDFVPETGEEKLVGYADNFHSKRPKFNRYEEIKKRLAQYGEENVKKLEEMKEMFGVPVTDLL